MKTIKSLFFLAAILVALPMAGQKFNADINKSTIKWEGKKIGGAHNGAIQLKEGNLTIKNNTITEGNFVIDMKSITNSDVESDEYKAKLVGHLKSDDFFGVEKYPTSKLTIKEATEFKNNKATVTGDLTIKETTLPVTFEVNKNGNTYSTVLTIDRSKYDIRYGSKSFFDNLGDKVIYDDFTLDVKLVVE